jgi:hypothetical protein
MKVLIAIFFFSVTRPALGQSQYLNCDDISDSDVYNLVSLVIRADHLDINSSFNRKPLFLNENQSRTGDFALYLKDTLTYANLMDSSGDLVVRPLGGRHFLEYADLSYMQCQDMTHKQFIWDQKRFPFIGKNGLTYSFSVPYFNRKHDIAIISYDISNYDIYRRYTYKLTKKGLGWEVMRLSVSLY